MQDIWLVHKLLTSRRVLFTTLRNCR